MPRIAPLSGPHWRGLRAGLLGAGLLGAGLLVGCPGGGGKTSTPEPEPAAKSRALPKTSKTEGRKTKVRKPPKPRFRPPPTRAFEVTVRSRRGSAQGERTRQLSLRVTQRPVGAVRLAGVAFAGLSGAPQETSLDFDEERQLTGSSDVPLLSLLREAQQAAKKRRESAPRVLYLPGGGWVRVQLAARKRLGETSWARRPCSGEEVRARIQGQLQSGESFRGTLRSEVWQDTETREVLALKGMQRLEFRYQEESRVAYAITPQVGKSVASVAGAGPPWEERFTDPLARELAHAHLAANLSGAHLATRGLVFPPAVWAPPALVQAGAILAGLTTLKDAPQLSSGLVVAKRQEPGKVRLSLEPLSARAGRAPLALEDGPDHLILIKEGSRARALYVSAEVFAKTKKGQAFQASQGSARDTSLRRRPPRPAELKQLREARRAGKPAAELELK